MKAIGQHQRTEVSGKDVNGLCMVGCLDCGTYAHAVDVASAEKDLAATTCAPDCSNCNGLRHSCDKRPAVPIGGTCNTILHTCPKDGNKWWQFNSFFHLWQQVTRPREWEILLQEQRTPWPQFVEFFD